MSEIEFRPLPSYFPFLWTGTLNLLLYVELVLSHLFCVVSLAKTVTTQLPRFFAFHVFRARYNNVTETLRKLKFLAQNVMKIVLNVLMEVSVAQSASAFGC